MKRSNRAEHGSRQRAAIQAIRAFEAQQRDWTYHDLAAALGVIPQQAYTLIGRLSAKGVLVQTETIVRKRRLMLAPADVAAQAA